jgi:beta-xylosidase
MIKTSGKYYLILAEGMYPFHSYSHYTRVYTTQGGTELGHRATMASAPTVWGPWTAVENNPILSAVSADGLFQTVGHADLFQDANSEWWIIALASRVVGESFPIGRETVMMKVDWRGDAPVVDTKAIDYPVSHLTDAPKENGTWEDVLAATGKNRHDHLLHLRIPETGTIQYQKDNTVLLVPKAGHRVSLGETLGSPSFLGVRQRHLHFECYVHFAVRYTGSQTAPEDIGAGLTVYLDHERHYSAYASRHGVSFEINQPGVAPISTLTSVTAPSSSEPVMNTFLRVIGTPDKYEFYYAPRGLATEIGNGDENAWEKLGEALTSGVSGGFTGTIIALYTVPGEGSDGAAYEVKASRWMYRSTAKEY